MRTNKCTIFNRNLSCDAVKNTRYFISPLNRVNVMKIRIVNLYSTANIYILADVNL